MPVADNGPGYVLFDEPFYGLDLSGLASEPARHARAAGQGVAWMDGLLQQHGIGLALVDIGWGSIDRRVHSSIGIATIQAPPRCSGDAARMGASDKRYYPYQNDLIWIIYSQQQLMASSCKKQERNMQDRSAIVAALEAAAEAWSRGDLDAFMQSYEDDADVTYVSGDIIVRGFDPIRKMYEARFVGDSGGMGHLSLSILACRPLGADYAMVTGRYSLERPTESGGDAEGHFTLVVRRTDQGWRILLDHAS